MTQEFEYYCAHCDEYLNKEEMEQHINNEPEHNIYANRIGADVEI